MDTQVKLTLDIEENELYVYLLENIYDALGSNTLSGSEMKIAKPEAVFDVTKKTIWKNFRLICKELNSKEEHVSNFLAKEYSTTISINQEGQLLIKGRYSDIMIGSTIKKYIKTFLQCGACHTLNTTVERKPNKLTYLVCNNEKCRLEQVIKYNL
jgi:translation initiation factor 2 beta subunit (eIF-2beta)/eIF-5